MKKQLTQLMPTLVVMVLILALPVAIYNISLRQEEEECFNRLENASEKKKKKTLDWKRFLK